LKSQSLSIAGASVVLAVWLRAPDRDPVTGVRPVDPFRDHHGLGGSELVLRVCSALVLVPLAVATAYFGGWSFAVFWGAAAIATFWEWTSLMAVSRRRSIMTIGGVSLVLAVVLAASGHVLAALMVLAIGFVGAAALAPTQRRIWVAAGVPYSGSIAVAPIVLRSDPEHGFLAIIFLFVIVWGTDTIAYFVGRAIGGLRLMPRVSPNKTWAGALAGTAAAVVAGLIVARAVSFSGTFAIAVLAALLSVLAQGGDLFESFLKRRFGAKDSGRLIPGHGGLMDRLDGFVAAGVIAALIGVVRGGLEAPGRGLLIW
jgi:phosphatidate cytidylyltransferase